MNEAANISHLRHTGDAVQAARATYIHGLLKDERWSISQAALRLGMTKSVLASRMKGETAFLATEIESIAHLLRRDPVQLFADYLAVGPAGIEPTTSTVESRRFTTPATQLPADIIPLFRPRTRAI